MRPSAAKSLPTARPPLSGAGRSSPKLSATRELNVTAEPVDKILQPGGQTQLIAAHRGFVSVAHDQVSILSDVAELGWRARHGVAFSYSATLFHHEHRRLRSLGGAKVEGTVLAAGPMLVIDEIPLYVIPEQVFPDPDGPVDYRAYG